MNRQAKIDSILATFWRVINKAEACAPTVHRVESLRVARELRDEILEILTPADLARADAQLNRIEQDCRQRGLIQAYAEMSRPGRRRLMKTSGGHD